MPHFLLKEETGFDRLSPNGFREAPIGGFPKQESLLPAFPQKEACLNAIA